MNELMDDTDFQANFNDELGGFGSDYGSSDDNNLGNVHGHVELPGTTSFAGTGGGREGIRLVLPNPSPYSNDNPNMAGLSLAPSATFGQSHAPQPGFLYPPSQQLSRGRHPASVGSSPVASGASSPLLNGGRFKEKKKRRRLTSEETRILVDVFERTQKPNGPLRKELAARLNMTSRAIQIWFQNRRAKVKRDTAGGESESGIDASPPPEETAGFKSEYSSAAASVVGTPMASAPGSSYATPNHTPPASAHGTPTNKRSQKLSLAHSVADSLLWKNGKASPQQYIQPFGGTGGKNVPLAPRPTPAVPKAPNQTYAHSPQGGSLPNSHYVHQSQTQSVQPQHQHVLLQLHQQHQQHQIQQQQQISDSIHSHQQQNYADRPGIQNRPFFLSPTRNMGVDPARLSKNADSPEDDSMDLDVFPLMTDESAPQKTSPFYDEYAAGAADRLSPFLFDSNTTYLPSADPELSSPTTAELLSSYLTAAERTVLAEDPEPAPTSANTENDLFDAFHMFTRSSGDDISMLLMQGNQDAVTSPSGRRRYSIGVNSTYDAQEPSSEHFPRRSRSLAAIFDTTPTGKASKPLFGTGPDEYWNAELPKTEDSIFDSLVFEPPDASSSPEFGMDTSEMFEPSGSQSAVAEGPDEASVALARTTVDLSHRCRTSSDSHNASPPSNDTRRGPPVDVRKKLGMPGSPSPLASSLPLETYTTISSSAPPFPLGAVSSPRSKRRRSVDDNVNLLTQLNLGLTVVPQQDHNGSTYNGQPKVKRGFAM